MSAPATLEYAQIEAEQTASIEAVSPISNEASQRHVKEFLEQHGLWGVVDTPALKPQQLEPLLQGSEFSQLPLQAQAVVWGSYATALNFSEQQEEALRAIDTAIALFKEHPTIWYNRGVLLANLTRYEEACTAFDQAVELKPSYSEAWYNRGAAFRLLGQHQKAVDSFNHALAIRQDYPLAWRGLGKTLRQLGRFAEAVESYDRSLTYQLDDYESWYGRAEALRNLEEYDEALRSYSRALELQPESPEVWNDRGVILATKNKDYEEALRSIERAYSLRRKLSATRTNNVAGAVISLLFGLSALKRQWLPDLETATRAFIKWRDRSRRDKQTAAFKEAIEGFKEELPEEDKETYDEFMLGVRLSSIRDPFSRWDAIAKEISKVWPEGVSAVDAIREQRE